MESGLFVLSVQDSGVGIPNSDLGKIFEKFHRVENVFGRSIEGTGAFPLHICGQHLTKVQELAYLSPSN